MVNKNNWINIIGCQGINVGYTFRSIFILLQDDEVDTIIELIEFPVDTFEVFNLVYIEFTSPIIWKNIVKNAQ